MKQLVHERYILSRIKSLDWTLILLIGLIIILGISLLYSAAQGDLEPWALKQLYIAISFIPVMILVSLININFIYKNAYYFYFIGMIFLAIAEIYGYKAMGAQRWIRIGFINFQPSEFMKIFVILVLARYFHDLSFKDIGNIQKLFIPTLLILLPVILILKQPNLGTALIILIISASIFFCAGVRMWKFISLIILTIGSSPIVWMCMHDYQKKRVLTFLNPENDPLGAGYNIIQSLIAIGSGGMFGKGFLEGSQSQLDFLPEKQTDFIFTILAEEFGFFGVLIVFILCFSILYRCFVISISNKNQFSRLLIIGFSSMFAFHIIINLAMIAALIPIVGTPFPLLSYGGSNFIATLVGFGIILSTTHIKNKADLK